MIEDLAEMPGPQFGFDYLYKCLVEVVNMESIPADRLTITTARLRAIIEGERSRIKRVNKWNREIANAGN